MFSHICKILKTNYQHCHASPLSASLSDRMEQQCCHCAQCREILYSIVFLHSVANIQVPLTSDKSTQHFKCRPLYIYGHISLVSN